MTVNHTPERRNLSPLFDILIECREQENNTVSKLIDAFSEWEMSLREREVRAAYHAAGFVDPANVMAEYIIRAIESMPDYFLAISQASRYINSTHTSLCEACEAMSVLDHATESLHYLSIKNGTEPKAEYAAIALRASFYNNMSPRQFIEGLGEACQLFHNRTVISSATAPDVQQYEAVKALYEAVDRTEVWSIIDPSRPESEELKGCNEDMQCGKEADNEE